MLTGYKMRIRIRYAWLVLLSTFLFSCTDPIPVPHSKEKYIGLWVSSDRYISIFAIGNLEYRKKLSFGMHNRVTGNFTFEGTIINMNMFGSFVIDKSPYEEDDQWKMQMDGVLYIRTGPPISYGKSNNWPDGVN